MGRGRTTSRRQPTTEPGVGKEEVAAAGRPAHRQVVSRRFQVIDGAGDPICRGGNPLGGEPWGGPVLPVDHMTAEQHRPDCPGWLPSRDFVPAACGLALKSHPLFSTADAVRGSDHNVPWLPIDPSAGVPAPGETTTLPIAADATGLHPGRPRSSDGRARATTAARPRPLLDVTLECSSRHERTDPLLWLGGRPCGRRRASLTQAQASRRR